MPTYVPLTVEYVSRWWRKYKDQVAQGINSVEEWRAAERDREEHEEFIADDNVPCIRYLSHDVPDGHVDASTEIVLDEQPEFRFIPTGALEYGNIEGLDTNLHLNWLDEFDPRVSSGPYNNEGETHLIYCLTGHLFWEETFVKEFGVQFCTKPLNLLSENAIAGEIMWVPKQ